MNWLKQNWIKIVVITLFLGALVFIKGKSDYSSDTALISHTSPPIQTKSETNEVSILSPDESLTAFIKSYPENDVAGKYGVYGRIAYNEIWIKDNNTGEEKPLVKTGDVSNYPFANSDNFPFSDIYNLNSPAFSLDSKKVYFLSSAWTTSNAVFSVDVSTSKLHLVSDGNSLEVIDAGPYKGNLITAKHRYYGPPNYGSYDHYYVIADSGKEIKDLGDANDNYSPEDCENYYEAEAFEKPIPIVWTAKLDGCLVSCLGASFTRVPTDKKYPRFAGYYPDDQSIPDKFLRDGLILKIYGNWTGVDADHPWTVFENKCVPMLDIQKIEIVK